MQFRRALVCCGRFIIEGVKFKTVIQNRPDIACTRTCCHDPFKGFFSLEKLAPFYGLVRAAQAAKASRADNTPRSNQ
jgi:hypothetical protein